MLFNSSIFIFVFLPLVVVVYRSLIVHGLTAAARFWLVIASLYFYAYWKLSYLPLLLASIFVNYVLGLLIIRARENGSRGSSRAILAAGLFFNLGLLGYFKYAAFIVEVANTAAGTGFQFDALVLPLAISFFTFQQIAYLVDCYKGVAHEYNFLNYCVFVSFFPQLIAGPIVHHSEMMPQFEAVQRGQALAHGKLATMQGLLIFSVGLFKKVCLADSFAVFADVGYASDSLSWADAWMTSLSYTMQLYYDFSGYSDMAIGAALLFGIRLPVNFMSPYRATTIREFWRRWHITLSRWLRDYVFIPLGGSRIGRLMTLRNLFITFLVGGVWHGAGWNFIIWGSLHGLAIVVHRLWSDNGRRLPSWAAWCLTFSFVSLAWVFFRAPDVDAAQKMLRALFSPDATGMSPEYLYSVLTGYENPVFSALVTLLNTSLLWIMPPVILATLFARDVVELSGYRQGSVPLSTAKVILSAILFFLAAVFILAGTPSVFLYFNF